MHEFALYKTPRAREDGEDRSAPRRGRSTEPGLCGLPVKGLLAKTTNSFRSLGAKPLPARLRFSVVLTERQAMTEDRFPMTRDEYDALKAKIDHMQSAQMIEITKRVATARDMGDLSENAEYHAAREDQGMLQAKINHLKNELSRAEIIDMNNVARDVVAFGARVRVKDLDLEEEETFFLVGPGKEDFSQNKILTNSPIGKGLVGKKKGDVAEIHVPMGTLRFQVVEIAFGD